MKYWALGTTVTWRDARLAGRSRHGSLVVARVLGRVFAFSSPAYLCLIDPFTIIAIVKLVASMSLEGIHPRSG